MTDLKVREQLVGVRETRNVAFRDVELREKPNGTGGSTLGFEGYASVTEEPFEMWDMFGPFTEIIRHGSFAKTISEGCDTGFLVNHEGLHLARTKSATLRLAEDDVGLHVDADFDPASPYVAGLRSALERKDIDEMSMAFRVTRQTWSPDYDQRDIFEVNLDKGDVSAVNYAANPAAHGGLRSLRSLNELRAAGAGRSFLRGLAELRAGKTLSTSTMSTLQEVLDLITTADDSVDEALETLSDLMGVPNPDKPEPDAEDVGEKKSYPLALALARQRALVLH